MGGEIFALRRPRPYSRLAGRSSRGIAAQTCICAKTGINGHGVGGSRCGAPRRCKSRASPCAAWDAHGGGDGTPFGSQCHPRKRPTVGAGSSRFSRRFPRPPPAPPPGKPPPPIHLSGYRKPRTVRGKSPPSPRGHRPAGYSHSRPPRRATFAAFLGRNASPSSQRSINCSNQPTKKNRPTWP